MSLVEVHPSTVSSLKVVPTAPPRAGASTSGGTRASVVSTASIVAMFGASIPAPLAMPPTENPPPSTTTSFAWVSVVRIASAASAAAGREPSRAPASAGSAPRSRSRSSGRPIRPVEQTRTCSASSPSTSASAEALALAAATPAGPVAAFAQPLFKRTAPARPPLDKRCPRLTVTGAAAARLEVKVAAAGTGRTGSAATRARSSTPPALIPQASPAAANPLGAVTLTG